MSTSFTTQDAWDFFQKMWNPLGIPMPGMAGGGMPPFANPAALFANLDPAEVERKINELRVVEGWLTTQVSMVQMTIKALELQKASLEAMRVDVSAQHASPPPEPKPAKPRRKRGG